MGAALKKRQEGQPPQVIGHRKNKQIAVVAVARELVGSLWAVMQDLDIAHDVEEAA